MRPDGAKIGRIGGSYDLKYIRGSYWICPLGHEWHYSNVTIRQAKAEGLDRCPQCGKRGRGHGTQTPL